MKQKKWLPLTKTEIDGKPCWKYGNFTLIGTKGQEQQLKNMLYEELKISKIINDQLGITASCTKQKPICSSKPKPQK